MRRHSKTIRDKWADPPEGYTRWVTLRRIGDSVIITPYGGMPIRMRFMGINGDDVKVAVEAEISALIEWQTPEPDSAN